MGGSQALPARPGLGHIRVAAGAGLGGSAGQFCALALHHGPRALQLGQDHASAQLVLGNGEGAEGEAGGEQFGGEGACGGEAGAAQQSGGLGGGERAQTEGKLARCAKIERPAGNGPVQRVARGPLERRPADHQGRGAVGALQHASTQVPPDRAVAQHAPPARVVGHELGQGEPGHKREDGQTEPVGREGGVELPDARLGGGGGKQRAGLHADGAHKVSGCHSGWLVPGNVVIWCRARLWSALLPEPGG